MAETSIFTWGGWGFVGAFVAILAFATTLAQAWGNSYKAAIREQLEDGRDRARIRAELEGQTTAFQRYQSALAAFTTWAEAWFGAPWHWRALDRCLQIAFVYPIALLLLAWVMGSPGTIGPIMVLPDQPTDRRLVTAIVLIAMSAGIFLILEKNVPQRFADRVTAWLFDAAATEQVDVPRLRNSVNFMARPIASAVSGAVMGATAFAAALAGVFAGAGTFVGPVAVAVVGTVFGAFSVAFAGAVAVAVAVVGAIFGASAVAVAGAVILVVFLVVLPLANAALDILSWGITRSLLAKIDHGGRGSRGFALVVVALVFDIVVAMASLIGLVALTAMALEIAAVLLVRIGAPEFDWRSQIELARAYPFTEGLLVTGMLATTLLPTAIHLTLGIGHAMSVWSPSAQDTAKLIHDDMAASAKQAVARVMLYRKLWMLPAFLVVCLLGWCLFAAFSAWVEPFGLLLEQVALASAGLITMP